MELPLVPVPLKAGAHRDPALPTMKRVKSGYVHPLRSHCFRATSAAFTPEQLVGVQNLPSTAVTYVYQMEEKENDTIKRHRASRNIELDKPFADGLLQKGMPLLIFSISVPHQA